MNTPLNVGWTKDYRVQCHATCLKILEPGQCLSRDAVVTSIGILAPKAWLVLDPNMVQSGDVGIFGADNHSQVLLPFPIRSTDSARTPQDIWVLVVVRRKWEPAFRHGVAFQVDLYDPTHDFEVERKGAVRSHRDKYREIVENKLKGWLLTNLCLATPAHEIAEYNESSTGLAVFLFAVEVMVSDTELRDMTVVQDGTSPSHQIKERLEIFSDLYLLSLPHRAW